MIRGRSLLRILLFLSICVVFLGFGWFSFLMLIFSGTKSTYLLLYFLFYLEIFLFCLLLCWNFQIIKKFKSIFLVFFSLICLGLGVVYILDLYEENITVLQERGLDLHAYKPFTAESQVAQLTEPATLQLEGDLPKIDCATALYPVAASFVQAVYPPGDYTLNEQEFLTSTTSRMAFDRLLTGEADIIFVAQPSETQLAKAKEKGLSFTLTPIGKEAFVFFVHAHNPVENLTVNQIQDIYSGKVKNWLEIGGKNQEIKAFQREANSGSQTMLEKIMQEKPLQAPPRDDRPSGMGGMVRVVADYKNYPAALGFSFLHYTTKLVNNKEIKLLSINGVEANKQNIATGDYPFTTEIYAVTLGDSKPNVRLFLHWILSGQGQSLLEASGYTGINKKDAE